MQDQRHKERKRRDFIRFAERHPERLKELRRAATARYAARHPEKERAKARRRRVGMARATPAWANSFFIEEIYDLARLRSEITGYRWHVDHVVPLKHPLVCGLHVEHNLQVVPAAVNLKKGNGLASSNAH